MKRVTGVVLVLLAMLCACNTVKGFGEDLNVAGRALSAVADKVMGREATATAPTPAQVPAAGSSASPRGPVTPWPAPPPPEPLPRAPQEPEEPK